MLVDIGVWYFDDIDYVFIVNRVVFCLISIYVFDKKKVLYWVVIIGVDSFCFYFYDLDVDIYNKMEF